MDLLLQVCLIQQQDVVLFLEGNKAVSVLLGCVLQLPVSLPELGLQHPNGLLQREKTAVSRRKLPQGPWS